MSLIFTRPDPLDESGLAVELDDAGFSDALFLADDAVPAFWAIEAINDQTSQAITESDRPAILAVLDVHTGQPSEAVIDIQESTARTRHLVETLRQFAVEAEITDTEWDTLTANQKDRELQQLFRKSGRAWQGLSDVLVYYEFPQEPTPQS